MTPTFESEDGGVRLCEWHGCYDKPLKGFIVPEAFSHPAKFSLALIERIYDHCLERGYLHRGDRVGDPFGGVATGGIVAAYRGLEWVGVELEERFCRRATGHACPGVTKTQWLRFNHRWQRMPGYKDLCPACETPIKYERGCGWVPFRLPHRYVGNIEHHAKKLKSMGLPIPIITQGDSRRFAETVAGVVTSPPYAESVHDGNGIDCSKLADQHKGSGPRGQAFAEGYGTTFGQIGRLKSGSVEAVVSSPPYAAISTGAGGLNTKPAKHAGQQSGRSASASSQDTDQRYGETEGQISRLSAGSIDAAVTSPPYEEGLGHGGGSCPIANDTKGTAQAMRDGYGNGDSQIGNSKGETYWTAMAQVYASCFQAIRPGGVLVLVLKDYIKAGKRVPLCDDTARLLEHIGFTPLERIHAMLVKERRHLDLFQGESVDTKSRKSFFRRLAEKKGSPPIDYEEVLIFRRPD